MNFQVSHVPAPSGMKPSTIRPLLSAFVVHRQMATLAVMAALFMSTPAHAATKYWSGNGSTAGGDGTWNTTTVNRWATATAGPWTLAWVNANNDIAENSSGTSNITLGANITLGGFTQEAGGSSTSNSIEQGSGPFTLTLGISGANTFLAAANSTTGRFLIVNAAIAGGAGKNLVLAGPSTSGTGNITLGRANTFSGTTNFSAGVTGGASVILKHQLAFQNSTVTLSADANLIFDSSVTADAFTFGGLAASSAGTGSNLALRNNDASSSPIALTVGGNNSSTAYKGVLSGGGSLIKTGSGTLTLTAANTYTGITTVSTGTLQVDGSTASPTTVNNAATLAGSGTVNAAVTVAAGGSLSPGANNLTVSNLTFSGTGTLNVGSLSDFTSVAAVKVNNILTVGGGAGAVTINLPTAPGLNGTYHLMQFVSGPANASGFTLGTVPTLAWNQTGALQVNGNYLDYVITAAGDTTPPTLSNILPADNATNVLADADLVATFDETIVAGSGSIELRRTSDTSLVESFNVTTSTRLVFSTAQLIIQPTNVLPTGQSYYVLIPAGAVKDTTGNNYAGIIINTGWSFTVPVPPVLFTDTGSPANPLWSAILPTLNVDSPDTGPVYGSLIQVNNAAVELGLYGNRPISVTNQRIHVACNTSSTSFSNFTRWFQTDGNTHVLRIFVDDENTATSREGVSSHTEAFNGGGWEYADNMTYEWTGHYTGARILQGSTSFQLMNNQNEWAVHLGLSSNGTVNVDNRNGTDRVVTNPDGSAKVFGSSGFDVRVLDDGLNYRVFVDGVLYASSTYSRPAGSTTNFRWGMYFGANNLNPPADFNIIMMSGVQIKSWPGRLTDATTTITKANNTTNLDAGGSWVGGVDPGLHNQALWNSTVAAANTTTLASYQQWAGLKIANPGGTVTINGSAILGLDDSGVDMTSATRDLVVNCPVQLTAASSWNVASGRKATFNGIISGYPGLTVNGAGTVQLEAANTYSGDTTVSAGTLVANDNSALGTGLLILNGGNLSNTASCTLGNDVDLSSNATVSVAASQTLTLKGAIAGTGSLTKGDTGTLKLSGANTYTGATLVSAGTLAIGNTSALLPTSSLTLAGGTVLQPNLDGVVISAPITLGASGTTATISAPTNNPGSGLVSTLTLKSVLAGSGNVTFSSSLNANALSTVYLAAQSTYAGSTLLNTTASTDGTTTAGENQIIAKLGINNALPPTTVLTIDGGNGSGTGRFAELNLNGFNQQLAGLTNIVRSGSRAALRIQRVVNSNVSAAATLTINNSSNHTFSGNLGGSVGGSVAAAAMPGTTNGNNFGLTKSGVGTFTLTGANTYSGDTTVNGGTLSLGTTNASNNASTVTIAASAALLQLNFAGTDTVAKLFIGTSQKPAGTYGHSSTGATNGGLGVGTMNAYFAAGTGTLTVTSSPPNDYSSWAALNSTGQTIDLDHDNDGVKNGIEYFLGGNTNTTGFTALPAVTKTSGTLSVTWPKAATYTGTYGTHFWVETSATLSGAWAIETAGVNVTFPSATEVKYTFPAGTNKFARLKVTGP